MSYAVDGITGIAFNSWSGRLEECWEMNVGVMGLAVSDAERPLLCNLPWREADLAAAKAPWLGDDFILASRKPLVFLLGVVALEPRDVKLWPASSYLMEAGYVMPFELESQARVAAMVVEGILALDKDFTWSSNGRAMFKEVKRPRIPPAIASSVSWLDVYSVDGISLEDNQTMLASSEDGLRGLLALLCPSRKPTSQEKTAETRAPSGVSQGK